MLGVKDIEKCVSVEFDNDDALWTLESGYEKILGIKLLCKKINSSRVLNFSSANERLTEEDMASCSRAFWKPKNVKIAKKRGR